MRLADDERARVPFAIVGVLLLVSSATLATTFLTRPSGGAEADGDAAMERADAAVTTALRAAVDRAARNAAADPVVTPANTTYGRVLNESRAFRDALELRVYLQARRALAGIEASAGEARVTADLPPIDGPADARAAIERVSLARTGNGTVSVAIANVSATLWRHDRFVDRRTTTVRFTSATPVLVAHDRVAEYERRLNRGPTEGRGLGRQFASRLYAWTWARGYAQFGGLPVDNVLGNRHVSLSANEAALATQRGVFGTSDDAGRRALGRARGRLLAQEAVDQTPGETGISPAQWTDLVLGEPDGSFADATPDVAPVPETGTPPTTHDDPVTVGVNESAAEAFRRLLDGDGGPTLERLVRRTYSASVRVHATSRQVAAEPALPARPPGPGWERRGRRTTRTVTVDSGSAPVPTRAPGSTRFLTFERVVTVTETTTTAWARGGNRTETERTSNRTYRVGVAVDAAPAALAPGSDGRVAGAFQPGGVLGGETPSAVRQPVRSVLADRGGPDAVAAAAARGQLDESPTVVFGPPPEDATDTAYLAAAALRDRTRNRSVTTTRGDLVTTATPAASLADGIAADRPELVSAGDPYPSVSARLRAAARAAYLDRLLDELGSRADATARSRDGADEALSDHGHSLAEADATMNASANTTRRAAPPVGTAGPAGQVSFEVAAAPSYLVTSELDTDRARAVRADGFAPLAARNVNLFTVPYGAAADTVTRQVDRGASGDRVALATGSPALAAMEHAGRVAENASARQRRARLRDAVGSSLASVRAQVATDLATTTTLAHSEANAAVAAAYEQYPTDAARAAAVVNGSLVPHIAHEAADRIATDGDGGAAPSARQRDELRLRARTALRTARQSEAARLPQGPVGDASSFLRDRQRSLVSAGARSALQNGVEGYLNGSSDEEVPHTFSGVPLVPMYSWVVTTNVWVVEVRGTYPRFAVRADRGTPAAPGGFDYSRDGAPVAFDVNGDGTAERVGHADRVAFENSVAVVIAVPAGKQGVGDRNGVADEHTSGWPCPSPGRWPDPTGPGTDAGAENASDCSTDLYTSGRTDDHVPRTPDRRVGTVATRAGSRVRRRPRRHRRGPRRGRRR
ncbi:DUF7286 family protein [Haloarchaeobius iranensis]|uniref:DUF7286 family protein n=1 Tax=Haloarchaeobius iranensis TaxID=996166 RepID=UPI0015874B1C|nr:hypothetical protein [Haloarchaeobius iranensis]